MGGIGRGYPAIHGEVEEPMTEQLEELDSINEGEEPRMHNRRNKNNRTLEAVAIETEEKFEFPAQKRAKRLGWMEVEKILGHKLHCGWLS